MGHALKQRTVENGWKAISIKKHHVEDSNRSYRSFAAPEGKNLFFPLPSARCPFSFFASKVDTAVKFLTSVASSWRVTASCHISYDVKSGICFMKWGNHEPHKQRYMWTANKTKAMQCVPWPRGEADHLTMRKIRKRNKRFPTDLGAVPPCFPKWILLSFHRGHVWLRKTLVICCFAEGWFTVTLERGLFWKPNNNKNFPSTKPKPGVWKCTSTSIVFGMVFVQASKNKFCSVSSEMCVEEAITLCTCVTTHWKYYPHCIQDLIVDSGQAKGCCILYFLACNAPDNHLNFGGKVLRNGY